MKVADLINPVTRSWNKQFIEVAFWPIDCERILAIPIGAIISEDRLVWHYSKEGIYSVKTAYQVMYDARCSEAGSSMRASSGVLDVNWQEIWRLDIPPKIRMFLWRVCKNFLPHALELFRSHISTNPFCVRCKSEVEATVHVLMVCRGLREIWQSSLFGISKINDQASPWALFKLMKKELHREGFLIAMVICWKA